MTFREQAQSMPKTEIIDLLEQSEQRIAELEQRVQWLQQQFFGRKSERRILAVSDAQMSLGESADEQAFAATAPESSTTVPAHTRRKSRPRSKDFVSDQGLRFDDTVRVEVIRIPNPEMEALSPDEYDIVGERSFYRLAQEPVQHVVLQYIRTAIRRKDTREIVCPPALPSVLERSVADVSVLAGLLIDKFSFHLPLYRQHQRMLAAGITLDRSTLTQWVHRTAELLEPIRQAQMRSILQSRTLAMDETPIRAGRSKTKSKGKMRQGYFWPVYGDQDEVVFHFERSRSGKTVPKVLDGYEGVLLSDGYEAYERFAKQTHAVVHAQCWAHTRRKFVEAETAEPQLCADMLDRIGRLYEQEKKIREQELTDEAKLQHRAEHSRPIVEGIFQALRRALDERMLLPQSPFTKAAGYALRREAALKVFLEYPDVPVDTNHLEREIRPIALGRKNWLFCWSEAGAEVVATVQSLLATCRLQGIDAYTYLVDVLQRVATHPASDVETLTPRLWKEHFAQDPMRSIVDRRATPDADAESRAS